LLLLRQVERRLGLLKAVAKVLPDPRNPWLVQHTTEQLLRQRVFGLCQGYRTSCHAWWPNQFRLLLAALAPKSSRG
jgi:Transposase DDE domain group 1